MKHYDLKTKDFHFLEVQTQSMSLSFNSDLLVKLLGSLFSASCHISITVYQELGERNVSVVGGQ
jgi:hypothetical protein